LNTKNEANEHGNNRWEFGVLKIFVIIVYKKLEQSYN